MFFPESYLSALGFFSYNAYVSYLPDDRAGEGQIGCICNQSYSAFGVLRGRVGHGEMNMAVVLDHHCSPHHGPCIVILASSVSFLILKGRVIARVLTV